MNPRYPSCMSSSVDFSVPHVPKARALSATQAKVLSKEQSNTLRRMAETGKRLVRQAGGVWVLEGTVVANPKHIMKASAGIPTDGLTVTDWCVRTTTVDSLEMRGLLQRVGAHPEAWKDDRELTAAGRARALELADSGRE